MSTIITNKNSNIDYIQNDSLLSNVSNKFPINSENIININNSDKNEIEIENESEIKDVIKEEKKNKKEKKFSESEMEHKTVDEIYNYINDNSDVKVKKKKRNKKKKNKKIQINKEINIINEENNRYIKKNIFLSLPKLENRDNRINRTFLQALNLTMNNQRNKTIDTLYSYNNTKYENGCKGGRPKNNLDKTEIKPKNNLNESEAKRKEKEKEKNKDKNNNNIIKEKIIKKENEELNNLFFNNEYYKNKDILVNKIKEWLEYKQQRKDKKYTEIGFNKLLKQIENNVNKYGEQQVIELIDECMSNNYQGIIFDKLKNKKEEIKKYSDEWWEKV